MNHSSKKSKRHLDMWIIIPIPIPKWLDAKLRTKPLHFTVKAQLYLLNMLHNKCEAILLLLLNSYIYLKLFANFDAWIKTSWSLETAVMLIVQRLILNKHGHLFVCLVGWYCSPPKTLFSALYISQMKTVNSALHGSNSSSHLKTETMWLVSDEFWLIRLK